MHSNPRVRILVGDCRQALKKLRPNSCHVCVTSPPYVNLRDYESPNQIGLGETVDEYVRSIVSVAQLIRSVLRPDGIFWLNVGDAYVNKTRTGCSRSPGDPSSTLKYKDAMLIPFRLALALQADGWWVRADNIWQKPNAQPENVDRPNKDHEYIFMLAKSKTTWFDQLSVRQWARTTEGKFSDHNMRTVWSINTEASKTSHQATFPERIPALCIKASTSEAGCCPHCGESWKRTLLRAKHTSRHELDLVEPAVKKTRSSDNRLRGPSGRTDIVQSIGWEQACQCPEHEPVPCTVLDPFAGSGTTGVVAAQLKRDAILIEISEKYIPSIFRRVSRETPNVKIER